MVGPGLTIFLIVLGGFASHAIHRFREHLTKDQCPARQLPKLTEPYT